jgi:hypothetical protein
MAPALAWYLLRAFLLDHVMVQSNTWKDPKQKW